MLSTHLRLGLPRYARGTLSLWHIDSYSFVYIRSHGNVFTGPLRNNKGVGNIDVHVDMRKDNHTNIS
jgi:hypothetical protein